MTAASLTWSASSERTTLEVARVVDYLGLVVLLGTVLDARTWRPAAAGLGFGALLVSALALGSRLIPAAFPADTVAGALHFDRLSYPLGYWNAVAAWGAMSATFGLAWSAHDKSRASRALRSRSCRSRSQPPISHIPEPAWPGPRSAWSPCSRSAATA